MSYIRVCYKSCSLFSLNPFLPQKSREPKLYKLFVITKYREKINNTENWVSKIVCYSVNLSCNEILIYVTLCLQEIRVASF